MIAADTPFTWFVRAVAPLVWRQPRRIARKLDGFASTEAGSALDMLKAAELTHDPKLRRIFFRHALDEARHAQMFRAAARAMVPRPEASEYALIHARRQNLLENLGLDRFIAFVYLAERRGEAQFRALYGHFARHAALGPLFATIAKDERFHVSYSRRQLELWREEGRGRAVRRALFSVRIASLRAAWLRSGRILGDALSRGIFAVVYFTALPLFALVARWREPDSAGWHRQAPVVHSIDAARGQM